MDVRIDPHPLAGSVEAIASKSMAHRLLTLSALCDGICDLRFNTTSADIEATVRCLTALGARPQRTRDGIRMVPVTVGGVRAGARLDVGESGSTLRFLLPVLAALGKGGTLEGHGRLAQRPLAPLDEQLISHGVTLSARGAFPLEVSGTLTPGTFCLPGNVSSQYVSGLLMAAPLMAGAVEVLVTEPVESRPYIDLTACALKTFGVTVEQASTTHKGVPVRSYRVASGARLSSPARCAVEGDWSNAAFWFAAGALASEPVCVTGLDPASHQGDRSILGALALLGARVSKSSGIVATSRERLRAACVDVAAIPDLVPPLAAVAAMAEGTTRICNAARLRLKESDRLETVAAAINALGGHASIEGDDLLICGVPSLSGGTVDAANDHRIAMMAAVCAAHASGPTIIRGAECVAKSYPDFFHDFASLGGVATALEG